MVKKVTLTFIGNFDVFEASWDSLLKYCDSAMRDQTLDAFKQGEYRLSPAALVWTTLGQRPAPLLKRFFAIEYTPEPTNEDIPCYDTNWCEHMWTPIEDPLRLQIDVPHCRSKRTLAALLCLQERLGGRVHDRAYRSFGTEKTARRICFCMTFRRAPQNDYVFLSPLFKILHDKNIAEALVGWTSMYDYPDDAFCMHAESLQWLGSDIRQVINLGVAISKYKVLVTLAPKQTLPQLTNAVNEYNDSLPAESRHRVTKIETNVPNRVEAIVWRDSRQIQFAPKASRDCLAQRWFDVFVRIVPHEPVFYEEMVRGAVTGFIRFLSTKGWTTNEDPIFYFNGNDDFVQPWVLVAFENSLVARAFYYRMHDRPLTSESGSNFWWAECFNAAFSAELRSKERVLALTDVPDSKFTPEVLQQVFPAVAAETWAQITGDAMQYTKGEDFANGASFDYDGAEGMAECS